MARGAYCRPKGTLTYPPPAMEEDEEEKPGDTYVGSMNHGKREGTGKYTWTSGAVYEGSYNDNKKQGQGVMTFPDKGKYEGTWEDDKMHGDGSYYYANGDIYAGSFREGKKHGKGMYYFKAHNCQFLGSWKEGQFADGKWVHKNGTMFQGSFDNSVPNEGRFYFAGSGLSQAGRYEAAKGWKGGPVEVATAVAAGLSA